MIIFVGKTFTGDYLQHIWNFGHVDGDQPLKQGHLNKDYEKLGNDIVEAIGKYWMKETDAPKEKWQPYADELVKLTLEEAEKSDDHGGNVVLSFAMIRREMRNYTKMKLLEAGAVDVTFLFLHCTMDVLLDAKWKRTLQFMEAGGLSMEEGTIFTPGLIGEFNYTNFCKFEREFGTSGHSERPSTSEKPYKEVNVSARDITVLDKIDETLGLGKRNHNFEMMDYNEIELVVKSINNVRDKEFAKNVDMEKLKENLMNITTSSNINSNTNTNTNDDEESEKFV